MACPNGQDQTLVEYPRRRRGGCLDCWDAWHLSSRWERCHLAGSDGCSRLGSRKWSHRYDPSGVAGCLVGGLLSYQQAPPRSLEPIRLARSRDRKLDRQVHDLLEPPLDRLASDFGATLWRGGPAKLASRLCGLGSSTAPWRFSHHDCGAHRIGRTPPFHRTYGHGALPPSLSSHPRRTVRNCCNDLSMPLWVVIQFDGRLSILTRRFWSRGRASRSKGWVQSSSPLGRPTISPRQGERTRRRRTLPSCRRCRDGACTYPATRTRSKRSCGRRLPEANSTTSVSGSLAKGVDKIHLVGEDSSRSRLQSSGS